MAMTLRLTDEETELLRAYAARQGRSMQAVVHTAILQFIAQDEHRSRVLESSRAGAARYAEALRRLGDS